jgi:hypothetical protein
VVKRGLTLCCLLLACATREGTVLVAHDLDAASEDLRDADEAEAESETEPEDAARDAASDAGSADTRGRCRIGGNPDGFNESFSGSALNATRWLIAHGPVSHAGKRTPGGFARENVSVENGSLVLRVRGDQYDGPVRGVDADGRPLASERRSAAAVATRDMFASATYQAQGRFVGPSGVEVALWFTRDDEQQGAITLATPGRDGDTPSYAFVHMASRDGATSFEHQFALAASFDDRASHILRFDWYTTVDNAVDFWIDNARRFQSKSSLPSRRAGRLWIVAWLREGTPAPFDTAEIQVENAFVTPFGNDGDLCVDGELAGPFLTLP